MLRMLVVALAGLGLPLALAAAEPGFKTELVGGTPGEFPTKGSVRLDLSDADTMLLQAGKTALRVSYQKVNTLEYGQSVSRRIAAAVLISPVFLLSKTRKHFVTLGFVDEAGKQQSLVLRVDKGDIRSVLAGLEARTGRRVEFLDDDARKAGKG
ncbi:MAG: hypothetical protein ACLQKA_23130 [Bryobacteraceae bacterium]